MTRYVWRNDRFEDRATGEPMEAPDRVCLPSIIKDVAYFCPVSMKPVTSRSERREVMKRHGVREVDPSEFTPTYRQKKNAVANKAEWDPHAGMRAPDGTEAPFHRLSRDELPAKLRKSVA